MMSDGKETVAVVAEASAQRAFRPRLSIFFTLEFSALASIDPEPTFRKPLTARNRKPGHHLRKHLV